MHSPLSSPSVSFPSGRVADGLRGGAMVLRSEVESLVASFDRASEALRAMDRLDLGSRSMAEVDRLVARELLLRAASAAVDCADFVLLIRRVVESEWGKVSSTEPVPEQLQLALNLVAGVEE